MFDRRLPLWYQLAEIVRGEILAGHRAASSRLPPEVELADRYGVSVVTVRQALHALADERLISRHRGRGTFVTAGPHRRKELRLRGSVETLIAEPMSEEAEVVEPRAVPVPVVVAGWFPGEHEVVCFRRLRRDRGVPLNYAVNWVVPEYGSQITAAQLRGHPMLTVLRDVLGVKLSHVQVAIEAQRATREVAQPLGIDVLSPILLFTGVVFDQRQRVVDVAQIHYRADRFTFTLDLDVSA